MQQKLWKANAIVFISSFCVMVIELIAARILAPYIGVSLIYLDQHHRGDTGRDCARQFYRRKNR